MRGDIGISCSRIAILGKGSGFDAAVEVENE
jgi:hypothetical protein